MKTCILPELLGKWHTKPTRIMQNSILPSNPSEMSADTSGCDEQKFCYCGGPEQGTMIACEHEDCPIEWFHMDCLLITTAPKGKWYCPDCSKLPKGNKRVVYHQQVHVTNKRFTECLYYILVRTMTLINIVPMFCEL